jgi:hypothetical protein
MSSGVASPTRWASGPSLRRLQQQRHQNYSSTEPASERWTTKFPLFTEDCMMADFAANLSGLFAANAWRCDFDPWTIKNDDVAQ